MSAPKIVLKKLKALDAIYHQETKLVFNDDKVVIGIFDSQTKKLLPLDEDSIKLCEQWGFKYEIPDGSSEEQEDDEGSVEEGEDEEVKHEEVSVDTEVPTDSVPEVLPIISQVVSIPAQINTPSENDNECIQSLTTKMQNYINEFSTQINTSEKKYLNRINELENSLSNKTKDFDNMTEQYNNMTLQYNNMKAEHDKLKQKFDNIKNLFS